MSRLTAQVCDCPVHVANAFQRYHQETGEGEIYQTSLMSALIAGVYEGTTTIKELLEHGDFGLGTFNQLDGELIAFDSEVFQLKSDGSANRARHEQCTPFAVMTWFKPEIELPLVRPVSREQIHQIVNEFAPSQNLFCAVRIDGEFNFVRTRTVPKQERPYRPMVEVVEEQPTFTFENAKGVVVGFRTPEYFTGINVPGYHEHFITDDRLGGGHIQEYQVKSGKIQIGRVSKLFIDTPTTVDFLDANLNPEDIQAAIEKTEQ
ncbi:Alpha-acetolactate decarboxylase [Vibrio aerogenes CECT 7868]|uniref:Alpha-acetolactate decarboxylase n=1 Tax=Vibrio aerogenes CECT 7868 TaxID=1216006 RepID=A0A1M5WUK9_9VIBR|nr:acetolactate decarboxylase [Vibrio aerogenes]SHH91130.1 Alpha-acetolactate decarboxylase [Vibrio aerogenes CECT 7868]